MPERLDGAAFADSSLTSLAAAANRCARGRGRPPLLAIVTASADPGQEGYVARKRDAAGRAGVAVRRVALGGTADAATVAAALADLGADADVDGIFCQLPLDSVRPAALDAVLGAIPACKDVDGGSPTSRAALERGLDHLDAADGGGPAWRPATPLAALELLRWRDVPVGGRTALVIGGHPDADALARLLELSGAHVRRVQHAGRHGLSDRPVSVPSAAPSPDASGSQSPAVSGSRSTGVSGFERSVGPPYDLVVAAGQLPKEPPPGLLSERVALIDLGYAPVRPLLPEAWIRRARWHCPARGGLGPATIAVLLRQTVEAALGEPPR